MTSPAATTGTGPTGGDGAAGPLGHAFEHPADTGRGGQRRALGWALAVNTALLVVELAAGVVFGSLALLADAAHLVSDVAGLGIALGGLILAARPASPAHSFGFARAEVLAAQVSALLLLAAGGWILVEGVARARTPTPVNGAGLAAVAALGILINAGSAVLVHRAQGRSLNMRASFVHLATDAAGSLAALGAGLLIVGWGWSRADAVVSLATAGLVMWAGWGLLRDATHVLMDGVPRGLDPEQVTAGIRSADGVADLHHLHLWNLASDVPALSAHVVLVGEPTLGQAQHTAGQIRQLLADRFALTNVTLELETVEDLHPATGPQAGNRSATDRDPKERHEYPDQP
jgi:cobalt-zinc-cadmium efflux system protein